MFRISCVFVAIAVALTPLVTRADDGPDLLQTARDARARQAAANEAYDAAYAEYRKHWQVVDQARKAGATPTDEQQKAVSVAMAALTRARNERTQVKDAFREAFAATDWDAWDVAEEREIVTDGLLEVLNHETNTGDPATGVRAGEALLEKLPDAEPCAGRVQYTLLRALSKTGALGDALARLPALLETSQDTAWASRSKILAGDLHAVLGDPSAARSLYDEVLATIPEDEPDRGLAGVRRYAVLRAGLVGKPAPEIDASTWLGGEATPLSSLRGKVVVVDFWATWCGPCRAVMPHLDELHRAHVEQGLVVLGVTRPYTRGYLPEAEGKQAEYIREFPESEFLDHLREFRARTGFAYPSVVAAQEDFARYGVRSIPTLAVVDRAGDIALVLVGSGSESLLDAALERLLADAADPR